MFSYKELIENIKNTFNIPISKIADLLNVSRKEIYKWLANTSTPEQDTQKLINKFSQTADKFKAAGIRHPGSLLEMKTFSGHSISKILLTGSDTTKQVEILIEESKIMEESYEKSGLSRSKAIPTNDWQAYISIPGKPEN